MGTAAGAAALVTPIKANASTLTSPALSTSRQRVIQATAAALVGLPGSGVTRSSLQGAATLVARWYEQGDDQLRLTVDVAADAIASGREAVRYAQLSDSARVSFLRRRLQDGSAFGPARAPRAQLGAAGLEVVASAARGSGAPSWYSPVAAIERG